MRAFILAALFLTACASAPSAETPVPAHSQLAQQIRADLARLDRELAAPGIAAAGIGETADLGGGVTVRPLAVIEDSRCAANVQCIWAGRLRIRALVSGQERELTLGETQNGVTFAVAKPSPWNEWPESELPRPAYRFGFRRG